jgi:hypothetical protein
MTTRKIIRKTDHEDTDYQNEAREYLAAAGSQSMHLDEPGSWEAQIVQAQASIGSGYALLAVAEQLQRIKTELAATRLSQP